MIATARGGTKPKPLIICLPGSFDSADYASYRSWLKCLPELGADVRTLDMLRLPGVGQVGKSDRGPVYYCDWHPDDYINLIESTIEGLQPSKVVLLGFGFGAYEAMRSAFAFSLLGRPVAGVVGITPNSLQYTPATYHENRDLPKMPLAELHEGEVVELFTERPQLGQNQLLSCVRYEDLRKPQNGAASTFYISKRVLSRYRTPLSEQLLARARAYRRGHFSHTGEVLRASQYTTPTALIAASDSWYLPPARVGALARRSRRAPTSYSEIPGVCYDFRAYPSQIEHVTEVVMDKVGQLLNTGTVRQPRPSHTLLVRQRATLEQPLETIVLSSARPPYHHRPALELAKASNANLVVLASHELKPDVVAAEMEEQGVRGCVIDVPSRYNLPLMAGFASNKHPMIKERGSNLSVKRNIGLLFGRLADQKTFFLDDDICDLSTQKLRWAGAQLDCYGVAGFSATAFPDNSVVCHANRLAGGDQSIFISGSALGVNATRSPSFFPNVYNEDWLFMYDAVASSKAVFLGNVRQLEYNPFDPRRATDEEFGDILAEGLYYLLASGAGYAQAGEEFWRYYLWRRRKFIARVAKGLVARPDDDGSAAQALTALAASRRKLGTFKSQDFTSYIQAWRSDVGRWRQLLGPLPKHQSFTDAAKYIAHMAGLNVRLVEA